MFHSLSGKFLAIALFLSCSLALAAGQKPEAPPAPQTARQALIEMLKGGASGWSKHLTVELKQQIDEQTKAKDLRGGYLAVMSPFTSIGLQKGTEIFSDGPVLLSVQEPNSSEKIEVRIDSEDPHGDQEDIQISIHLFRDGQEKNIPFFSGITVGLKKQKEIWRLNEISAPVKLAVGDPQFFEDLAGLNGPSAKQEASSGSAPPVREERPPLGIIPVMNYLAYAESSYAGQHPEAGFTCSLSDLVGPLSESSALDRLIDPSIAGGSYNGYRFSITGCGSRPSETFHIVAEPDHTGPATTAFCVNSTHVVRSSDDGRGATCLAAGVVTHRPQTSID
ncbi:MAG TPA: hypothetical protein VNW97_03465 [Candidatus Saccharimonadales bacterium]|jgi:hypothetical protein|nr:hypothetical protein [Candidatus Saccharimonadales bacterium]